MSSRVTQAFILDASEQGRLLRRVPADQCPFAFETDLQELLRQHPELLGVEQIDPVYSPAICIAREASMSGNNIDNLHISPEGYISIIEAKLWKNQELRRKVLAQIIEYASLLSKRKYSDIEEMFSRYMRKYHPDRAQTSLHAWVAEQSDQPIDEHDFRRNASRCLAAGEFLLLIVAERIGENTEELIEFVNSTPGLAYSLHLVELTCYQLEQGSRPLLIVPRVIARTTQVERAIVRVQISDSRTVDVNVGGPGTVATRVASDEREKNASASRAIPALVSSQAVSDFLKLLETGGITTRRKGALSLTILFPPVNGVELSGFWIQNNEKLFVSRMNDQLKEAGLPAHTGDVLWSSLHAIDESFPPPEFFVTRQFKGLDFQDLVAGQKLPRVAEAIIQFAHQLRSASAEPSESKT